MATLPEHDLVSEHLGTPDFVKAVMSVPIDKDASPWQKITVRKVELQRGAVLQVARFDGKNVDTKSVEADDPLIAEITALRFKHVTVQLANARIESRITKKGKVLSTRTAAASEVSTAHDRLKVRLVAESAPFLEVLGLASGGSVKPTGQRKYRQINEFIRAILGAPGVEEILDRSPIRVVDFGCGNAYLTFAVYHYLHEVRGLTCVIQGVDRDMTLMSRANQRVAELGWTGLSFSAGNISETSLAAAPHMVIALHACDTATDDVLVRAVEWNAPVVLVSPCCHHDVQRQLRVSSAPSDYSSIVRKGLLKERLGDVLTDSLRCDLLGLLGYQTEVIEFVSLEHTAKNLMIRASRTGRAADSDHVVQYTSLRDQWNLEPYLERALATRLAPILNQQLPAPVGPPAIS